MIPEVPWFDRKKKKRSALPDNRRQKSLVAAVILLRQGFSSVCAAVKLYRRKLTPADIPAGPV